MSETIMTMAEFERLLDLHGGEPARWPEEKREAAAALLAGDAAARARLDEEMRFQALLGGAMAVEAPAHLAARTADSVRRRRAGGLARLLDWRWLIAAGSAATAFGIGLGVLIGPAALIDPDSILAAAFGGTIL